MSQTQANKKLLIAFFFFLKLEKYSIRIADQS